MIASHAAFEPISSADPCSLALQPLAAMDRSAWDERLLEQMRLSPKKELQTILSVHLPKRLASSILTELHLQGTMQVSTLTKEQRRSVVDTLGDGISISAVKRRPGDEFVTAGGVSLDEIDPATMASTICP